MSQTPYTLEPHVVHVTAEPVAEDAVWCDECEEWVSSGAPEGRTPEPPSDVTENELASLIADGVVAYFKSLPLFSDLDDEAWADEHEIARGGQAHRSARAVLAAFHVTPRADA